MKVRSRAGLSVYLFITVYDLAGTGVIASPYEMTVTAESGADIDADDIPYESDESMFSNFLKKHQELSLAILLMFQQF